MRNPAIVAVMIDALMIVAWACLIAAVAFAVVDARRRNRQRKAAKALRRSRHDSDDRPG